MAPPAIPPRPPYAWVVEYRPLDRCFTPTCRIRTRDVHGYAKDTMEDGDPGAYVAQGPSIQKEQFLQRGVTLRSSESFDFDLPPAAHASALDVYVSSSDENKDYDATIEISEVPTLGAAKPMADPMRVQGHTAPFRTPTKLNAAQFTKYGKHVRLQLPSREHRTLRVSIKNHGGSKLSVGAPLVMRRVEGRGPRQGFMLVHDAVLFHEAAAYLSTGMGDKKADWVREAVADRGIYFPNGQSTGQGTGHFVIRFFTGQFFASWGWPAMFGKGFDETLPPLLLGPAARAAEQGFVITFMGNNFTFLPNVGHVGWDVGYQSEMSDHLAGMASFLSTWAEERPDDDALFVWWNAATHAPYPPGRNGPEPLQPPLPLGDTNKASVTGTWKNLLDSADQLKVGYDALRKASPRASRVMFIGADHSSSATQKMLRRSYRTSAYITTGLLHGCGGSAEETNTPFAIVFDDPEHRLPKLPRVVTERTSSLMVWRAFESFLGVDFGLPRSSTWQSPIFPNPAAYPIWDDRVLVALGTDGVVRATLGNDAYNQTPSRLTQTPAWQLTANEQLLLLGGPLRSESGIAEELYDDGADPYEMTNLASKNLDKTLRMRREVTDWLAAHYEEHDHPRHRTKLVFSETQELDLFAARPFTAVVDDAVVPSADPRLAHLRAKEVTIVETTDPVGMIELRGAKGPLVLKCSANGLPLDVLTPDRPRFNLAVARVNCPLAEGAHDVAGPGEVLFSFEPASARPVATSSPGLPTATGVGAQDDELLQGMKRWGYVRDIDQKKR